MKENNKNSKMNFSSLIKAILLSQRLPKKKTGLTVIVYKE